MNNFIAAIQQVTHLSPESIEAFSAIAKRSELPKSHLLVRENTVCSSIYFLEKGISRTFYYKDGKNITDWISTEGTFACSIVSFITRRPDIRNIELLEDSVIWAIHHDELERLYVVHHDIERLGRLLVSAGVVQMQHRFDELHFTSAAERYKRLLELHPDIVLRVPLGIIASYLGITQETLSRMRAQLQ